MIKVLCDQEEIFRVVELFRQRVRSEFIKSDVVKFTPWITIDGEEYSIQTKHGLLTIFILKDLWQGKKISHLLSLDPPDQYWKSEMELNFPVGFDRRIGGCCVSDGDDFIFANRGNFQISKKRINKDFIFDTFRDRVFDSFDDRKVSPLISITRLSSSDFSKEIASFLYRLNMAKWQYLSLSYDTEATRDRIKPPTTQKLLEKAPKKKNADSIEGTREFHPKVMQALESAGFKIYDGETQIHGKGQQHRRKPDYIAEGPLELIIGEIKCPKELRSEGWKNRFSGDPPEFAAVRDDVRKRAAAGEKYSVIRHEVNILGQIPNYYVNIGITFDLPTGIDRTKKIILGYSLPVVESIEVELALQGCKKGHFRKIDTGNGTVTYLFEP